MFPTPAQWAQAVVKKQGAPDAARIAQSEARPTYGMEGHTITNPNLGYFTQAFNWIVKRHPKAHPAKASENVAS